MGYTHGRRWSDETIEKEILNVKNALNIDRMPTNSEIKKVAGNGLACKVSKTGGFNYWRERLGLKQKESETKLGQEWEFNVKELLENMDYEVENMTTKHPYDLLVNNNIKVDVKVARYYKKDNYKFHTFNLEKKHHNCDIFICIGLDEEENVVKYMVIPSKYLMDKKQLSVGVNSKYDKFIDRWDYIEKYSGFYEVTI